MPKIRTDHSHVLLSCLYCFTNSQTLNCVLEDLHKTRSVKQNLLEVYLNGLYQTAYSFLFKLYNTLVSFLSNVELQRESMCLHLSVLSGGLCYMYLNKNIWEQATECYHHDNKKNCKIQDTVECKPYLSVILESESTIKISCKESPEKKLWGFIRFKPMTSVIPVRCSCNRYEASLEAGQEEVQFYTHLYIKRMILSVHVFNDVNHMYTCVDVYVHVYTVHCMHCG